jgi:hypothetical protein
MCPQVVLDGSAASQSLLSTTTYVSSYCYICVLILLYMCPQVVLDGSAASQSVLSTLDELVSVFLERERERECVCLCSVSQSLVSLWRRGLV